MEVLSGIFSAFGLSASAGLNAYIPLLVVALLGSAESSTFRATSRQETTAVRSARSGLDLHLRNRRAVREAAQEARFVRVEAS